MYSFEYVSSGHTRLSPVLSVHSNPVFDRRSGFTLPLYVYPHFSVLFSIMMAQAKPPVLRPAFVWLRFQYHKYTMAQILRME
jgi:hypothetical protein